MESHDRWMNASVYEPQKHLIMDKDTFLLAMFINGGIISTIISILGIGANLANIATFVRLGFNETINISLTALAVTDLASLICLLWTSICFIPAFCDLVCHVIDLHKVVDTIGGMQRSYFTIVAGCITTAIACERCLCVLKPLQVKVLLTKRKLVITILSVYVLVLIPFLPLACTTGLGWAFNSMTNRSILTVKYDAVFEMDFICFSVLVGVNVSTYVVVSLATAVIVWKLASQSAWRAGQSKDLADDQSKHEVADTKKGTSATVRDRRATRTVTFIAIMYIVCFLPGTVLILAMTFVPDFKVGMVYTNIYEMSWSVVFIFEGVSSSANILVYLKTSTKFKRAFLGLFNASSSINA